MATAIGCLVDEASAGLPEAATVVFAHPATWTGYMVDTLRGALDRAGLPDVTLISEAAASLHWLEATRGPLEDGVVMVYDLGAESLDVTLLRTGASPTVLGQPIRSEDFGGAQFDHLTMQYVLENVREAIPGLDPLDPRALSALTELRNRCRRAKEALSSETETVIAIDLPGTRSDVRLVRAELEDLIREPLLGSLDLVRESLRTAGIEPSDVSRVLLTGGGGAIPLVAELMSAELALPIVAASAPEQTAALGAAKAAYEIGAAGSADHADFASHADFGDHADEAPTDLLVAPAASALRAAHPRTAGMSPSKRVGIVAASVAAIALLTAGGLSISTEMEPQATQTVPSSARSTAAPAPILDGVAAGSTTTPATSSVSAVGMRNDHAGTPAPEATADTAAPGAGGTGAVAPASNAAPARAAGSSATPSSAAPAVTQAPAAPAPVTQAPAAPATPVAPVAPVVQQPAPSSPRSQYQSGGVGKGVGDAVGGVGQGLGDAVGGVGRGVGGVLQGVGEGVGGVLGG